MTDRPSPLPGADAPAPRWRIAGAAFLTLGLAAAAAQWLATVVFTAAEGVEPSWVGGTLLALAGAIYLGATSGTWAGFRRKARVWVAATAVAAFSMMGIDASRGAPRMAAAPAAAGSEQPVAGLRPFGAGMMGQ